MKCFDVVQKVLDATYTEIPGTDRQRDAAVTKALEKMSDQYRNKLVTSGGPDFSDPVTRFAYVHLYVPSSAHWLYELINWWPEAKKVFDAPKVRMTSLGGGPGSELVGVLKFMEGYKTPALFCEIVDGCIDWKQTWSDLAFTIDWPHGLHTDYVIHDAGNEGTWAAPSNFEKTDLFTVNFFASEIFHLGKPAKKYLTKAFKRARSGAIVLFQDNDAATFTNWFDAICADSSLKTIRSGHGERKVYDRGERTSVVYNGEKFGRGARLTGRVAWRVLKKV